MKSRDDSAAVIRNKSKSAGSAQRVSPRQEKKTTQLSRIDVAIDVAQVLGHLGVDARLARQSTAALASIAHDAHLHEAVVSVTKQRASVIPLQKHKTYIHAHVSNPLRNAYFQFSYLQLKTCFPHYSRFEEVNMCQLLEADQPQKHVTLYFEATSSFWYLKIL